MKVDAYDNVYLAGSTGSTVGIATPGAFQSELLSGGPNGFIAKFNSAGELQWGTYYPSEIFAFTVDNQGNIYVAGMTLRETGIATPGTFQQNFSHPGNDNPNNVSDMNGFLSKFDTNGNRVWGTYYGFSNPIGVGVDEFGAVYLAGGAGEKNDGFYATPNCFQSQKAGGFLTKFNENGQRVWSTYYGSGETDATTNIYDIKAFRNEIYLAGITTDNSNIASPGAYQTSLAGGIDTFLTRFDIEGNRVWATYYGGESTDFDIIFPYSGQMVSHLGNNVYLTFSTQSTTGIATAGAFKEDYTANGNPDNYIVKFTTQGERVWGTYYGGDGLESGSGVIPIDNTSFYTYGTTSSITNIATEGSAQPEFESNGYTIGTFNAYLTKFKPSDLKIKPVEEQKITLYPNPSDGKFTVNNIQNTSIQIYSLQGQLVYQEKAKAGRKNVRLNLSNLASGIYFVVLKKDNVQQKTIKIILQ